MKNALPFLAVALIAFPLTAPAATIALWNFNSRVPDSNPATGATAPIIGAGTASLVGGVTATFTEPNGSSDPSHDADNSNWRVTTWPAQSTQNRQNGIRFNVGTMGCRNIRMSWNLRNSNTASKYTRLQYTTNGTAFIDFQVITMPNETWVNGQSASFVGVPGVEDNPNFAVRFVTEFQSTATGSGLAGYVPSDSGSSYGTGGTLRFDMVRFYADDSDGSAVGSLSMLTFNILGSNASGWTLNSSNVQAIGRVLAYLQPDIIGFQEVPEDFRLLMADFIGSYLPGYYVAIGSSTGGAERSAVASRYPITRSKSWLVNRDLSAFGYDGDFTRDLFEAEITPPGFAQPLHFFTTHLKAHPDEESSIRRGAEARCISNFFATTYQATNALRPCVLVGDMNEDIYEPREFEQQAIQTMTSAQAGLKMNDPRNQVTGDDDTWSAQNDNPSIRFDYVLPNAILVSNLLSGQVFRSDKVSPSAPPLLATDSATASDHYPVMLVFNNPYYTFPADLHTKKFDGNLNGNGYAWATPANWYPDGVPTVGDDIVMDNTRQAPIRPTNTMSTFISVRSIEFMNNFAANNTWHLGNSGSGGNTLTVTPAGGVAHLIKVNCTGGSVEFRETVSGTDLLSFVVGASGEMNVVNANGLLDMQLVIKGAAGANITKNGPGTLRLREINTYAGHTYLKAGTVIIDGDSTFGNGTGTLYLQGGNITLVDDRTTGNNLQTPFNMSADTTIQNGSADAADFRHGGAWTTSGGTLTIRNTSSSAGQFTLILSNSFTFSRPIVIGPAGDSYPVELASYPLAGKIQTFSGVISGYGSFRHTVGAGHQDIPGDVILSGANTYSGGCLLYQGGTGLGSSSVGSPVTSGPCGTGDLSIGSSGNQYVVSVWAEGGARSIGNSIKLYSANWTLGGQYDLTFTGNCSIGGGITDKILTINNSAVTTFSGIMSGVGYNITKAGAGRLVLSGANTYSGNTTVSGGQLLVNGSIGSGAVTVQNTATLGGDGSVSGNLTVQSGGKLAPGVSIGTLTASANVTLESGSTTEVEVNRGASPNADQVQGIGTLTQGGTLSVINGGADLQVNDSFSLFGATTYGGQFAAISPAHPNSNPELAWDLPALKNSGVLRVHHVPSASDKTVYRTKGNSVNISLGDLFPATDAADRDAVALESFTAGSQGASIYQSGNFLIYEPTNDNNDAFDYTVTDNRGGARTKRVTINVLAASIGIVTITNGAAGNITLTSSGIPDYKYVIQRSPDLGAWSDVVTNTAASNGLIQYGELPLWNPTFYRIRTE